MRNTFFSLAVAALAGSCLANSGCKQKQNSSPSPSGNSINLPGATSQVPVGEAYDITWTPTNKDDIVSLVLLRGPSTAAEEFSCIVESTPNNGKYSWTPPTSLENDKSHYGIKIIVHGSGEYQYSTQFGIRNDNSPKKSGKKQTTATTTYHVKNTEKIYSTSYLSASGTGKPLTSSHTVTHTRSHKTESKSETKKPTHVPSPSYSKNQTTVHSTGHPVSHSSLPTIISSHYTNRTQTYSEPKPTKPITKPSSLEPLETSVTIVSAPLSSEVPTVTTSSEPVSQTSAGAVRVYAGGMLAGVGAVAALVL